MIGRRAPVLVFLVLLPLGSLLCQDTFHCTAIETTARPFSRPWITPLARVYLEGENRGWTGWCYTTSTVNGNTVTCSTQTYQCNDMDYEDGICSLCPSPTSPNPGSGYCCGRFTGGCSMYPVWNTETCNWQCQNVSPIILDVDGNGYHLTNAASGVLFDFLGHGQKIQMSWTAAGSTNAFLVLPDADGAVPSGKQLFGNITPQPKCAGGRNGWNALAVDDEPAFGGNGNGMIDLGDEIFSKLRLWQDLNHDGIAVDKYGNRFKYKGQVYGTKDSSLSRVAYDVFFTVQ